MDKVLKINVLIIVLIVSSGTILAQQAPSDISCRTSPTAIELSWVQQGFEKKTLFNNSELITHSGLGYAGADVSMYRYNTNGISALHSANRKAAEDFTLFDYDEDYDAAYVSDLVFYVFPQTYFDYTKSPVTEVFVQIYDNSPMDGGQLIYTTNANVKKSDTFFHAFRLNSNSSFTNRYMPLFEITADLGIVLPTGGPYWFVFSYDADQNCFLPMRTALNEFVPGNALFYKNGSWGIISTNPDDNPALAFKINGIWFFNDNPQVVGFNIYRDGEKVNDFLVTETHFLDKGLFDETQYSYTIEAVYSDESTISSDDYLVNTVSFSGVDNIDINVNVNEIQLNWVRPTDDENADISYNIYLDEQFIQNTEETHFSRGFFAQGSYSFRVDALYFNGLTIPGENRLVYVSDCFPPTNIKEEHDENLNVTLTWDEPLEENLMATFSGEMVNFLATSGFCCEWAIGQRYLPEDLEPYNGLAITQVAFIAGGPNNVYSIQIYTDNGFGGPDNLIYNQQIESFKVEAINKVYLETPVIIDADMVLWVVVDCCQTSEGNVFGMSDVVVDMKGNFLYRDFGSDNTSGWSTNGSSGCMEIYLGGDSKVMSNTREVRNYNVFRNNELIGSNLSGNAYSDNVPEIGIYTYGVQSVKSDCTSLVKEISVNVGYEDLIELNNPIISVYPNPSGNTLNIRTVLQNAHLEVYDLNGRLIHSQRITENVTTVDTGNWAEGVYVWKVISNGKLAETGKWMKK